MTEVSGGCYRRRIVVRAAHPELVLAELEDDFHHFAVRLGHDGRRITSVAADSIRYPWSTCPLAEAQLTPIVGMPLAARCTAIGAVIRGSHNCTHMFDLAGLAVAHAASGRTRRQYDMEVTDRVEGKGTANLWGDGELVLGWWLDGSWIVDPAPYAGQKLRGGFVRWAEELLDPEAAEAAIVLRRGCEIAFGRRHPLDHLDYAGSLLKGLSGACFTFQPSRAVNAKRMKGTAWDFTEHPERLLAGDPDGQQTKSIQ